MPTDATLTRDAVPRNKHGASTVIENVAGQRVPLIPPDYVDESRISLTDNSRKVLERRYLRRDLDGSLLETPGGMFYRVAYHIAQVEKQHGQDPDEAAEAFYKLMSEYRFFPNSPTFTGAGTPLGQLAACFVLPIEDDMGKSRDGIFSTLRVAALIQQTGGGNGFSFSRLRPKGDIVHTSAGRATGPVGFLRVYDQAFGEIAQGGCLLPETLVFTDRGLLRLDELVDTATEGWQEHKLHVATDEGRRPSPRGYNNGVAPVLKVTTKQGLALTGTYNHKVKVMSAEGPVWRRLDELQAGDSILVMLGQHQGRLQALRRPQQHHGNQLMPDFPPFLDEPLAFLLGYLAGDGFVASAADDHRIGFTVSHDSYLLEEFPKLLKQAFPGCTVRRQQKANDASVTFVIDNRAVKEFLVINGLAKARSTEVSVPRLVRQSPPPVIGAYLRGLLEADGALSHGYPQLNTTSYRLAQEVATLLIGLGCPATIRRHTDGERLGRAPQWLVRLHSHVALEAWRARIGCDLRSRFVRCYTHQPRLEREQSYRLPHTGWWVNPALEAITLPQHDRQGRGQGLHFTATDRGLRRKLLRYIRNDRRLTLSGYRLLAKRHPEFAAHARPVQDLWFVQVEQVEPAGEALTLDLEVEGNHTYLAYGLVTHNTRRGANMGVLRVDHPDIEEFIECKAKEGAIANFNISVAITDEFMQAVKDDTDFALRNPRNGEVNKVVRARDLFAKIIKYAHHNGEPGALFIDAANRSNPVPHLYALEATNPCVTGDTLVATPQGWRRADSIQVGDEICTVLGTGRVAEVEVNPQTPVYDVYLSDGGIVRATAAHQFHVRDSRTKFYESRRLDQIKPGDWVRVYPGTVPNNSVTPTAANLTDQEYGFLVGLLVGDGCYTPQGLAKNVMRVSSHAYDAQWNEIIEASFAKIGATAVRSYVNPGSHSMMLNPKPGRVVAAWVQSLPLEPARSDEKRLPEAYINSNREFLVGLLDGLFSTDGSVDLQSNHPLLRFHTASLELARQVRRILLMFGIHARIATSERKRHDINGRFIRNDRPKHDVVISGASLGRFFEQIRLSHPNKQMRLEEAALRSNFTGGNWAAKVLKIEPAGLATVYDLYEPRSDTWITEGYVSRGCGEQWLGPYENCCLGSINLGEHVTTDADGKPVVDWELLRRSVYESTHFLDNVVSANAYVPVVPEVAEAAYRARRIGLGIMGLGDMMYKLGIRYGSEEGQEFAGQIMEFVRYHCMEKSIELAAERGPFLAYEGSIYDPKRPEGMQWQPPAPLFPFSRDWGRPALDWNRIVQGIQDHGIRNAAQTTVAPTGTIATVCGCEGYGCEPVFALGYIRHFKDGDRNVELVYTSPLFEQALNSTSLGEARKKEIKQHVATVGTCQDVEDLPDAIRHTFVVSSDITAEEHVRMQAAIQAFVDNSISKTVNFFEGATEDDVAKAYMLAWELGCKGLTVYVTGTRQEVVLETKATKEKKGEGSGTAVVAVQGNESTYINGASSTPAIVDIKPVATKRPRPAILNGSTYRKETPLGTAYITVNSDDRGEPFEIFLNVGKAGSEVSAVSEAIGRLISLVLRMPGALPPTERLRWVMDEMAGIGGGRPLGFGAKRVRSLPDGIAQVLADHLSGLPPARDEQPAEQLALPIAQRPIGDICPECGEAAFLNVEGCRKCAVCGYSEC